MREVGRLLILHMSNFHSVVFSHTWYSGIVLEERSGEREQEKEGGGEGERTGEEKREGD